MNTIWLQFDSYRNSHRRCSVKKMFLEISQNSQENTCGRVSIFVGEPILLKKRLWHRCFRVNFVKFLRKPFLTEHLWWLLSLSGVMSLWTVFKWIHDIRTPFLTEHLWWLLSLSGVISLWTVFNWIHDILCVVARSSFWS